jgi:uncharacterized membrane protein (DUF485 family)
MLTPALRQHVAAVTRVLQIIMFALAMGVASYLAVTLATADGPLDPNPEITYGGIMFAIVGIVVGFVLNAVIAGKQRQQLAATAESGDESGLSRDAGALLGGYQTRRIIQGALLEGPAFLNIFAYQQARETYSLAIVGLLLAGLVMLIPLRPLVERWLENELREVRELRAMHRP